MRGILSLISGRPSALPLRLSILPPNVALTVLCIRVGGQCSASPDVRCKGCKLSLPSLECSSPVLFLMLSLALFELGNCREIHTLTPSSGGPFL